MTLEATSMTTAYGCNGIYLKEYLTVNTILIF